MNEESTRQLDTYFQAISAWRAAYESIRLNVLGVRVGNILEIVTARIHLGMQSSVELKTPFLAGRIEAYQIQLDQQERDVCAVMRSLASDGYHLPGCGAIRLSSTPQIGIFVAPPTLLHPEGINAGNRLAVLSIGGGALTGLLPQPESDWALKAADHPYDSVHELAADYGVGTLSTDRVLLEVVAHTVVQVLAESQVTGTNARIGVFMANGLDHTKAKLGFRVVHQGHVTNRGAIQGSQLAWSNRDNAVVGVADVEIPEGSVIQCIASYADQAHHIQWRADPTTLLNPRLVMFSLVDPRRELLQACLRPEIPPRGKAADDFEMAMAWLLWALGFSVVSFGTHAKTRDAFDLVCTSPRGDFVVVECTLGLLRAESKLSKLVARTAQVKESLITSNLRHVRVLPVIVTAMSREQVEADVGPATDLGVLVITRENLDEAQNELIRYPNPDALFERGMRSVQDRQSARNTESSTHHSAAAPG